MTQPRKFSLCLGVICELRRGSVMDLFLIVGPAGCTLLGGKDPFDPALACVIAIGLARLVGCPTAKARNYCIVVS